MSASSMCELSVRVGQSNRVGKTARLHGIPIFVMEKTRVAISDVEAFAGNCATDIPFGESCVSGWRFRRRAVLTVV
jgi:hypothetical protein